MTVQWQTLTFTELGLERLYAIMRLRQEVFVVEQNCVFLDLDNLDQQAVHMVCSQANNVLAYQRCIAPGPGRLESVLGRIVVCPAMRNQQLGRELVQRGIKHNLSRWPDGDILISAQAHLQDFYASAGFAGEGYEYLEDNIPHRKMRYRSDVTPPEFPAGK